MPDSLGALQNAFAAHLRDPKQTPCPAGIEPRRMAVYTDLFFNNIASLLAGNFPVVHSLHDEAAWRDLVRGFCRDHRSQTPLFTEFPGEFIAHLEQRADLRESFLPELAHYEWSELALNLDERDIAQTPHDPDGDVLDGVPVVSPLARMLAYRFPVHRIGPQFRPDEPGPTPTLLLLVRDRADVVRFLEVDPLSALLMERLQDNTRLSGLACLERLLDELGRAGDPTLQASGVTMLARLRERDALLGTRV